MKPYTKAYLKHFGYSPGEFIPCEICGSKAVDINHIDARGMGGNPAGDKDVLENLMAVLAVGNTGFFQKIQTVFKRRTR